MYFPNMARIALLPNLQILDLDQVHLVIQLTCTWRLTRDTGHVRSVLLPHAS